MKRLSDQPLVTDSERELMARVLAHIDPVQEDPELKRRVRLRLRAKGRADNKSTRPILALAMLLLVGAAAAHGSPHDLVTTVTARAKAWLGWAPRASHGPAKSQPSNRDFAAPLSPATPQPLAATPPEAAPLAANASSEPATSERHAAAKAMRRSPDDRSSAGSSVAVTAPVAASSNPPAQGPANAGSQLIIDALRARQAGDWGRAAALANAYRQSFPAGPLEEEALMLALESAAARGASTRGPAEQYLRLFPNGRYRKWATGLLAKAR